MTRKEANRLSSQKYRERHPERARRARKKCQDRIVALIRQIKGQPCTDCGIQYPYYVMDFDHTRGSKHFLICRPHHNLETLFAEIEKCDLVCKNCHAEREHQRRQAKKGKK